MSETTSSLSLLLQLLEALTKNCGKRFHVQIAQKDFLKDFGDVLNPKNSPPAGIQQTVLGLLQVMNIDPGRRLLLSAGESHLDLGCGIP